MANDELHKVQEPCIKLLKAQGYEEAFPGTNVSILDGVGRLDGVVQLIEFKPTLNKGAIDDAKDKLVRFLAAHREGSRSDGSVRAGLALWDGETVPVFRLIGGKLTEDTTDHARAMIRERGASDEVRIVVQHYKLEKLHTLCDGGPTEGGPRVPKAPRPSGVTKKKQGREPLPAEEAIVAELNEAHRAIYEAVRECALDLGLSLKETQTRGITFNRSNSVAVLNVPVPQASERGFLACVKESDLPKIEGLGATRVDKKKRYHDWIGHDCGNAETAIAVLNRVAANG